MSYSFICNKCNKLFDLDMTYTEYIGHKADKASNGKYRCNFFRCIYCNSIDTRRTYSPNPVIFVGEGFTKHTKEDSGHEHLT